MKENSHRRSFMFNVTSPCNIYSHPLSAMRNALKNKLRRLKRQWDEEIIMDQQSRAGGIGGKTLRVHTFRCFKRLFEGRWFNIYRSLSLSLSLSLSFSPFLSLSTSGSQEVSLWSRVSGMMQTRVHRARPNEDSFISRLMYKRKFRRSNLASVFHGKHHERLLLKPHAFNCTTSMVIVSPYL